VLPSVAGFFMAIYHLHAKLVKRGDRAGGRSVISAAAYRSASCLQDDRYGLCHDYTGKGKGVLFSAILTPENAPAWMSDREALWNAVEACEKRYDAQLARDIDVALPVELSHSRNKRLVLKWAKAELISRGIVADISIHEPRPNEHRERNPHAHVLLSLREAGPQGFGNKNREWNERSFLTALRESWEKAVNDALAEEGEKPRINHRSFGARGIDKMPTRHLGVATTVLERALVPTRKAALNRAIRFDNCQRPLLRAIAGSKEPFAFQLPAISGSWNGKVAEWNLRGPGSPTLPAPAGVVTLPPSNWRERCQRSEQASEKGQGRA
jgi:hypothetical protein